MQTLFSYLRCRQEWPCPPSMATVLFIVCKSWFENSLGCRLDVSPLYYISPVFVFPVCLCIDGMRWIVITAGTLVSDWHHSNTIRCTWLFIALEITTGEVNGKHEPCEGASEGAFNELSVSIAGHLACALDTLASHGSRSIQFRHDASATGATPHANEDRESNSLLKDMRIWLLGNSRTAAYYGNTATDQCLCALERAAAAKTHGHKTTTATRRG